MYVSKEPAIYSYTVADSNGGSYITVFDNRVVIDGKITMKTDGKFFNPLKLSKDEFLVRVCIDSESGMVISCEFGINKINNLSYTPTEVRQIINTTERVKDKGNNGRMSWMTYVSLICFEPENFIKSTSNIRFCMYNRTDSNELRSKKIGTIIETARNSRQKENISRFLFVPYGASVYNGHHIGVIIADLEAPKEKCITYFDSSHQFTLGMRDSGYSIFGDLSNSMIRDDDGELKPINDTPYQYNVINDTYGTNCSYWVESFLRIVSSIMSKDLNYTCELDGTAYTIGNLDNLKCMVNNQNFINHLKYQEKPDNIEIDSEEEYNCIGIQIATQLEPKELGVSDLIAEYPKDAPDHGKIFESYSSKKQTNTHNEQVVKLNTNALSTISTLPLTQSVLYPELAESTPVQQPENEAVPGLSALIDQLPQGFIDSVKKQQSKRRDKQKTIQGNLGL